MLYGVNFNLRPCDADVKIFIDSCPPWLISLKIKLSWKTLISNEISRAEHEYRNIHTHKHTPNTVCTLMLNMQWFFILEIRSTDSGIILLCRCIFTSFFSKCEEVEWRVFPVISKALAPSWPEFRSVNLCRCQLLNNWNNNVLFFSLMLKWIHLMINKLSQKYFCLAYRLLLIHCQCHQREW